MPQYVWVGCVECGIKRWVGLVRGEPRRKRCRRCASRTQERREASGRFNKGKFGIKNHNWKGGRITDKRKYIYIKLFPDDSFYPMAKKSGYVLEHRLVVAKFLGRCLHPWELVHHKNGIRNDNRIQNLELMPEMKHRQITFLVSYIKQLEKQILILKSKLEVR